ncbi:hypothetical protein AX774_g1674 [Zancudomyces culisetae]|uniref:Uncharacterized protein n=1 Tax=Zancudomyces culisetae TaxID=1213189 RepID=A0A1R1PV04_ZANCU|nr:hypothetical protein AX774_g1674 [Zancudomyces culisetae]|eukprot:OMH84790.1 hypothetical protein AX774_g1674 [Zancudomyces culisetae]
MGLRSLNTISASDTIARCATSINPSIANPSSVDNRSWFITHSCTFPTTKPKYCATRSSSRSPNNIGTSISLLTPSSFLIIEWYSLAHRSSCKIVRPSIWLPSAICAGKHGAMLSVTNIRSSITSPVEFTTSSSSFATSWKNSSILPLTISPIIPRNFSLYPLILRSGLPLTRVIPPPPPNPPNPAVPYTLFVPIFLLFSFIFSCSFLLCRSARSSISITFSN